jgi:hypothetical protein
MCKRNCATELPVHESEGYVVISYKALSVQAGASDQQQTSVKVQRIYQNPSLHASK